MKDKTWNQCKITLPTEIYASFAVLSNDDVNVHVIGGLNAKEQLFEKSELLKMSKMYRRMIELKNKITKMKLEIPCIIPIEKQRMNEDKRIKKKTQIETFEKKLKEWNEEKRMESNGMNWDDIWGFDGELQQTKKRVLIQMDDIPPIIKTLFCYQSSIKVKFYIDLALYYIK
ncbi:hypothetical protein RFI_20233 [Reticulomyxa filosa]|uniref:Uncharacterized protein n=1 Tax=Reticulomyxa filosa TaxID=46433 RepID=X6MVG8_RETFI|nr:hypothetical protein RFI_20233 [Reticulomyxa filosa]|eukprot:ETO17100.1 hypothetical protein RFI_20233 [Reticulomyxa filosa]